jgi:solute carrier family 25 protein 38
MSVDALNGLLCNDSAPNPIEAALIGVTARGIAGGILHPITVVKTRFESGQFKYSSLNHALKDVYCKEGLKGLYRGWTPTVLRDAPYSGLYYMFYSQLKITCSKILSDSNSIKHTISPSVTFACGLSAGLLASLVTQPFDVVKTKMQLQGSTYKNIYTASLIILEKKGINGFFSGATPRIMRRSLMSAISWTFFDTLTKAFSQK